MTIAGRIRETLLREAIARRGDSYAGADEGPEREAVQVELLNREWARIVSAVPYYRGLVARGELPPRFDSTGTFAAVVPPTRRADVHGSLDARTSEGRGPDFRRITGGSTAQPVQLPSWRSETAHTRIDMWLGRSWYGITPSSRLFLLWGHSHLLGTGAAGWLRARRMEWSDRLLGYHRHSAYDMRDERLREAAQTMIRFRPDYVIGYSVALERFAEVNGDQRDTLRHLGLRAVVGAAEGFPTPGGPHRLAELFGCPIAMEYGSVETGLVAHTVPEGGYRVLWRSYLLDAERHHTGWRLRVTSLYPRCFPLVRYDIGDEVELEPADVERRAGFARLRRVNGRCNDYVVLDDGSVVHSEAFTHAVRSCAEVRGYQIVQRGAAIRIRYTAAGSLSPAAEHEIRDRLSRIHPALAAVAFERVDSLPHTVAGKTRMVSVE